MINSQVLTGKERFEKRYGKHTTFFVKVRKREGFTAPENCDRTIPEERLVPQSHNTHRKAGRKIIAIFN